MCTLDGLSADAKPSGVSRRLFTASAFAGAAALSLARARAADITSKALCIMCIDPRLVDRGVQFFDSYIGAPPPPPQYRYDIVALAGGALAGVGPAFPESIAAFWSHVEIAKSLHDIQKIVVLDHRDCGAYKVQFGSQFTTDDPGEIDQHTQIMKLAKAEFERRRVGLPVEFWLMPIQPGQPVQIRV